MSRAAGLVVGCFAVATVLTGCGAGSSGTAGPATSPAAASSTPPAPSVSTTSGTVAAGAPTCPTMAQADAALGVADSGPIRTLTPGGGIVCEYTGAGGNAGVTIFAHEPAAVFAGQVAHAVGAPAMPRIAGVGDGAYGQTTGGRSVVNAYSDASRTTVAAQAPGSLGPVEALARVALADN